MNEGRDFCMSVFLHFSGILVHFSGMGMNQNSALYDIFEDIRGFDLYRIPFCFYFIVLLKLPPDFRCWMTGVPVLDYWDISETWGTPKPLWFIIFCQHFRDTPP